MIIKTEFGGLDVKLPISCLVPYKTKVQAEVASIDVEKVINLGKTALSSYRLFIGELPNDLGFVIFWIMGGCLTKPRTANLQKSTRVPKHVSVTGQFLGEKSWSVKKSS